MVINVKQQKNTNGSAWLLKSIHVHSKKRKSLKGLKDQHNLFFLLNIEHAASQYYHY